jgi:hypothetical protein
MVDDCCNGEPGTNPKKLNFNPNCKLRGGFVPPVCNIVADKKIGVVKDVESSSFLTTDKLSERFTL